jgi:hypothetical protein
VLHAARGLLNDDEFVNMVTTAKATRPRLFLVLLQTAPLRLNGLIGRHVPNLVAQELKPDRGRVPLMLDVLT